MANQNKIIICCCGKSYECSNRVKIAINIISHAVILSDKVGDEFFIFTYDELDPTELSVLQRLGMIAVMTDEIYQARPPRKYFVEGPDGGAADDISLDSDNEFDALEEALTQLSECHVCEEGK